MLSFDSLRALAFIVRVLWLKSIRAVAIGVLDKNHSFSVLIIYLRGTGKIAWREKLKVR